jgi:hypothetical protein
LAATLRPTLSRLPAPTSRGGNTGQPQKANAAPPLWGAALLQERVPSGAVNAGRVTKHDQVKGRR